MNPLLKEFLSALLRWVLTGAGGWFVQQGILNPEQADKMIAGAIVAVLALAWSLYSKYTAKVESNTLAAMPKGTTLEEAQKSIARGIAAPAGTGAGDVPVLVNTNTGDSVKPRGNSWLLPLLLASSLAAGASGCGGTLKPPVITPNDQAQVQDIAVKALAGFEIAGIIMRDGRQLVSDLEAAGTPGVTRAVRTAVNNAVIRANDDVIQPTITKIDRAVKKVGQLATLTDIKGWAREAINAFLSVARELEKQTDARVAMAGRFIRSALTVLGGHVGIEVTK